MLKTASDKIKSWHHRLLELARNRPLLLIGLFPAYILLSVLIGLIAVIAGTTLAENFNLRRTVFPFLAFGLIFGPGLCVIWVHYISINLIALVANVRIKGDSATVARIAQALLTTVFTFAVIYYYVQLFGDDKAFAGMHPIGANSDWIKWYWIDRLAMLPSYETMIDCFYYSVVTISTVGMGDIHPLTPLAKIITSCEIITGFILVVLSLGSVIGGKGD